jgi:T1SS-143 domain-containing protein
MTVQNAQASEINTPTGEAAGTQNFLTSNGIEGVPLEVAAQDAISIDKPAAGQTQEVTISEGQPYNLTFSETTVQSVIQEGDILTVTFTDNSVLIINNFEAATTASPAATLAFLDNGEVVETVPDETELETPQAEIREETTAANEPSAEEIAAVEPASGEDIAQQVANIEPAAGEDGATGDTSNTGFTFNDPDAAPVGPLGAVGPIDPTALQYGVEFQNDIVRPDEDTDTDTQPELLSPEAVSVDETNLGPITRTGQIEAEFGSDGPGTIAPDGTFTSSVPLTSGGAPVTVTPTTDGYIGSVGGITIFTITIDPATGDYEFILEGVLDHPDATDPNDNIALEFGIVAEDADGDQANTTLTVNVADDAPATAAPDTNTVDEAALATAPIVVNDSLIVDFGNDGAGSVSPDGTTSFSGTTTLTSGGNAVTITATPTGYVGTIAGGGTAFTITIDPATGAYTYTQTAPLDHDAAGSNTITLNFGAQVEDFDGDSTNTTIIVNITDSVPEISTPTVGAGIETVDESNLPGGSTASGSVDVSFGTDAPGALTANGTTTSSTPLLSDGLPVTITQTATGYVGTLVGGAIVFTLTIDPANGDYTFNQELPLDHPDTTDPDDAIQITFGITATDSDGDEDTGTITINVKDDGPEAVDDANTVAEKTTTVTGNVTANDDDGADVIATVTNVEFGATSVAVVAGTPTVINGDYGILTINTDGSYTYVINGTNTGAVTDTFTYTLTDNDGDTDTAKLDITIAAPDDKPELATPKALTVDETDIDAAPAGRDSASDTLVADFGNDGPGTFEVTGLPTFSFTGAQDGALESNGVAVTVAVVGNSYVGTLPTGETVFTLELNAQTGEYTFTEFLPLDHADATNPDDVLQLTFGVTAVDNEGDRSANGNIIINVLDDGPAIATPAVISFSEAGIDTGPITVNGDLVEDFGEDGAGTIAPTGTNSFAGVANLTSNGEAINITATADGYVGTLAGGAVAFTLTVNPATGAYSFTQNVALDHETGGSDTIALTFGVDITDFDGDKASTNIVINIVDSKPEINDTPEIGKGIETVDESNLPGGSTASGSVDVDFGADTPGSLTANGINSSSVPLTSNGVTVTVTSTATGYVGTLPGGETVFTLTIDPTNGDYTFTQTLPLDHPDSTDPDDAITLTFGITATDGDGDTDNGRIRINVKDDGPIAVDDTNTVPTTSNTVTGNVTANDDGGADVDATVTSIEFAGTNYIITPGTATVIDSPYGQLSINSDGSYTYVSNGTNTAIVDETFTYTLTDADGDTATADLTIRITDIDDEPLLVNPAELTVDETDLNPTDTDGNTISADFGADGPGTYEATGIASFSFSGATNDALTSNGVPVTVALVGNNYVGTANGSEVFRLELNQTTGEYDFILTGTLDHADTTDPDDTIVLNFGVTVKDTDGDSATGNIKVNVKDDGPFINSRAKPIDEDGLANGGTISYTHTLTHSYGEDGKGEINPTGKYAVKFQAGGPNQQLTSGGQDVTITATADGYVGTLATGETVFTLTVNNDGQYTYTQFTGIDHPDSNNANDVIWLKFEVEIVDADGDTDKAYITVDVADSGVILGEADELTVDETDLDPTDDASGAITATFPEGQGTFTATDAGTFTFNGAKDGTLTSNGVPVTVAIVGNDYVGTANGAEIFRLELNQTTGEYDFILSGQLDHADATNPDDVIALTFGVTVADQDGDSKTIDIKVNVKDDGPVAVDDAGTVPTTNNTISGNVLANDDGGADVVATVTQIEFAGNSVAVVPGTATVVNGTYGQLTINADGSYSYTSNGTNATVVDETFTYTLTDADGDSDTADLTITITDVDDEPLLVKPKELVVDETDMNPTDEAGGTISADFGADGPGTYEASGVNTFSFSGSTNPATLTSNGVPVVVALVGNNYVGTANGSEVFRLELNNTTGRYDFILSGQLDHADTTDPDDTIVLNFGVTVKDTDGDSASGMIKVNVKDDGPVAVADMNTVPENANSISGNVVANDDSGEDAVATVTAIEFAGNTVAVVPGTATVVNGTYGQLSINADGSYTYTSNGAQATIVQDSFTYTLTDADGDSDKADLTITITDADDEPLLVTPTALVVDETDLNPTDTDGNTISADFGVDGPGTYEATGVNTFTGATNDALTSNGVPVTVAIVGNNYVGSANGTEIFRLELNKTTGKYDFILSGTLDHADTTDHDDSIELTFGVTVKDTDDDSASGLINVIVKDDGPFINKRTNAVDEDSLETGPIVVSRSLEYSYGKDGAGEINATGNFTVMFEAGFQNETLSSNGSPITVTHTDDGYTGTTANGDIAFIVTIDDNGAYNYTQSLPLDHPDLTDPNDVIWLKFEVEIIDADGDTDTALIQIDVKDGFEVGPLLIVGKNVDDEIGQTTPWEIGNGDGQIVGNTNNDILVGDVGGSRLEQQNQDYNVVLILDTSGSMGGNDSETSRVSILSEAVKNLMSQFEAYENGNIVARVIDFSTGVKQEITIDFSQPNALANAIAHLDALTGSGLTNYESPLAAALDWLNNSPEVLPNAITTTYFISDGEPNRYDDNGSIERGSDAVILGEITGADGSDEVGDLQAFGEVIAVGIDIADDALANLNAVDSSGTATNLTDPADLDATLAAANPLNKLADVGDDVITGGAGDDLIYGDSVFTDTLADEQGLDTIDGNGWGVFTRLENGEGNKADWDREDTINYIRDNAESLSQESVGTEGDGRLGGNDTLDGGAGNDTIFGQEGNDVITGGAGNDVLYGGTGEDVFMYNAGDNGVDVIKDFTVGEDVLDISGMLQGYDALQDSINDFVFATEVGGNTVLSVDVDGAAGPATAVEIAVFEALTGLDIADITNNGETTV